MLHNKIFAIIEQFLGDYTKQIYGRELVKKVQLSQKNIALTLLALEKEAILKSKSSSNRRYYALNLENTEIRDILLMTEIIKKINFLKQQRKIANIFKADDRVVGIFGSFASGTQRKDSDIDIFVIGRKIGQDYEKAGKIFDLLLSVKYFEENKFKKLLKEKNNLCKEMIKNHIIIFNGERFINIIWRNYYGFN